MNNSDYVIKYLEDYGIKNVYGIVGGMSMYIFDSIRKSNLNLVSPMHEQSAGIMAEADSIYNEDLAVLFTTAGPGILNAVNPITSAYIDGNPLLVISGQCKIDDCKRDSELRQKGVQEVDAYKILKPITKEVYRLNSIKEINNILQEAIHTATSGRKGPVFIEIPLDVQNNQVVYYEKSYHDNISKINHSNTKRVLDKLNESEKPVLLLGNGLRDYRKLDNNKLLEIIKKLNIPVLTTWKSMDFIDEDNSLYFGRPGSISSRYANMVLQNCDLLISIGARLDKPTIAYDYGNFAKNAYKIIVDIDTEELEKIKEYESNYFSRYIRRGNLIAIPKEKSYYINSDAKSFLTDLDYLHNFNNNYIIQNWIEECALYKKKYPIKIPESISDNINPYSFIEELSKECNKNDIIVPSSSGSASEITCQTWKVKYGQRIICSNGLGSMGYALNHGIGACISSDKRRTIVIEGDGSFFMGNTAELELIKRYNLPIKIFIWSNDGYNSIRNTQNKFFDGELIACNADSGVTLPNLRNIANAYELDYFKIDDSDSDLNSQISEVLNSEKSIICEVVIDKEIQTQPKVMNKIDKNGNITSGKLEDMWPFLGEK